MSIVLITDNKLNSKTTTVLRSSAHSYGGNQAWFSGKRLTGFGCGVIACTNLLLSMGRNSDSVITRNRYMKLADQLAYRYLPVLPLFGMNGLLMAMGMNLYFLLHRMPYYSYWACPFGQIWTNLQKMLDQGLIPVLAVGPNFPLFFLKKKLNFYVRAPRSAAGSGEKSSAHATSGERSAAHIVEDSSGRYIRSCAASAHYVSVTEVGENWITISSWGNKYYVNKKEYEHYSRKYSMTLFSNILVVKHF